MRAGSCAERGLDVRHYGLNVQVNLAAPACTQPGLSPRLIRAHAVLLVCAIHCAAPRGVLRWSPSFPACPG